MRGINGYHTVLDFDAKGATILAAEVGSEDVDLGNGTLPGSGESSASTGGAGDLGWDAGIVIAKLLP